MKWRHRFLTCLKSKKDGRKKCPSLLKSNWKKCAKKYIPENLPKFS
jgi:hypothetical protein